MVCSKTRSLCDQHEDGIQIYWWIQVDYHHHYDYFYAWVPVMFIMMHATCIYIFPFNFLPHFLWITLQYISLVSSVVLVGIFVSILLKSLYCFSKASYGLFSSVFGCISLVQRNHIMPNLLTELPVIHFIFKYLF